MERRRIDRTQVCPFLLRVFFRESGEVLLDSLKNRTLAQEEDEVRLYTWKDANFREIIEMLKEHLPGARRRDAEFAFGLVRQDSEGAYENRDVGRVHAVRRGDHDLRTLHSLKFSIGEYLTLAISYSLN